MLIRLAIVLDAQGDKQGSESHKSRGKELDLKVIAPLV